MSTSLFLPAQGRCLPQDFPDSLQDPAAVELSVDIEAEIQRHGIERQLRSRIAMEVTLEAGIRHGERQIVRDLMASELTPAFIAMEEISSVLRGGAEEARLAHNQEVVGSTPTPATIDQTGSTVEHGAFVAPDDEAKAGLNCPSAHSSTPEQHNAFPKGRWTR